MLFKYWNYTTCIRSDNLTAIEQAVTHILEQEEGCQRLKQSPPIEFDVEELFHKRQMQKFSCCLWIVSLVAGAIGWTIIKTFPSRLLCWRTKGAGRPRLSTLAMQLGCDAFYLEVHNSTFGVLLEASATGRTYVSGGGPDEPNNQFYAEQIDKTGLIEQFSLLQVPEPMQTAMRVNSDPEVQKIKAEFNRLKKEDPDSELLTRLMDEALQGHTQRIDYALAKVINKSSSYWYSCNLAYDVYAHPGQLAAMEAQLLYFQPSEDYGQMDLKQLHSQF